MKLILYYNTIKYLKLIQIIGRIKFSLNKCLLNYLHSPVYRKNVPQSASIGLSNKIPFIFHDPWNSELKLSDNIFSFLHETIKFDIINWDLTEKSLLWKFNLNYFSYLHLINDKNAICEDWVRQNINRMRIGWHPYPTSLRIVNWCKNNIHSKINLESLNNQASFLYNNLEIHLLGNHLLENARGLIFAGLYFRNDEQAIKWYNKGINVYVNQLKEQILPDGGHFERSPMYHAIILEGLLDVINVISPGSTVLPTLKFYAELMLDFLAALTHPDGYICLFNDATQEISPSTDSIIKYAKALIGYSPSLKTEFPDSGYYIYKDEDIYFVIDCGDVGPNYIPGHSHADIFSFELSIRGLQVIVDTGTLDYLEGNYRHYVRGTKAHNTICIDDTNQVEVWKNFRLARRYSPTVILNNNSENEWLFEGMYEGYRHLLKDDIIHKRNVKIRKKEKKLVITDHILGKNIHKILWQLHFNSTIKVRENSIYINPDNILSFKINQEYTIHSKKIHPRFGVTNIGNCISVELKRNLPIKITIEINY